MPYEAFSTIPNSPIPNPEALYYAYYASSNSDDTIFN